MADELPWGLEAARLLSAWDEGRPLLHVTTQESRAEAIARFLAQAAPATRATVVPPWDVLPYDWASPSASAMGRRMAVLRRLSGPDSRPESGPDGAPRIVVTTPAALLQRLPPVGAAKGFPLRVGEPLDPDALRAFCESVGYRLDDRVDEPGEIALRGGVIDVFLAASDWPFRIEFADAVTAVRRYDPATQLSVEEVDDLVIDPASELPGLRPEDEEPGAEHRLFDAWPALSTLPDHLPGARITLAPGARRAATQTLAQIAEAHRERARDDTPARRTPPPERLYLTADDWAALRTEDLDATDWEPVPAFALDRRPRAAIAAFLQAQSEAGHRVLLTGHAGRDRARLNRRLREAGATPESAPDWPAALAMADPLPAIEPALDEGFIDRRAGLAVLAARDILGSRAGLAAAESLAAPWTLEAAELHEGDLVVHMDHGVACLDGLEAIATEGLEGEAIRLLYAEGQRLLVPATEAGRIWRYGADEGEVALDKLDTASWDKRRAKVAEGLAKTARALIEAAAAREATQAPKLDPDRAPYERLADRFPFEETPDQARAIAATLADMASGRPMNRLVIGDVGFGKTEVAIRAAAACAFAGKQAALLAPTTVLARQHFTNLTRRFEGLGVEVAQLSRLVTPAEAKRVKAGLADGSIRIVVGTQALLAKGVAFADLGLVVIDEEQRLGQADKQKARALVGAAHLLTMTATPIPRTLQSALVGLQDLSVIATPPARRRPIRTLLGDRTDDTLRHALTRERRRGGQSFVVVPRVEDIDAVARDIARLLPRLRLRVAHGQLPAREIDEVMVGFADGDGDVLLATSIIESGLDVPRANTMVVLRPDLFGLAQLHQLRGRVGRGGAQAFCHLLTEPGEDLPPATLKRLGTLQALDRLGAGMAISAQDLDLRGGGELFGDRQTGHVRLIGLGLYQELLADAIRAARGEAPRHREVDQAGATGTLPPDYIPEPEVRLNLYHRLARTQGPEDVDRLADEIADRFGPPPPPVQDLLRAAQVRALARTLGVTRISAGPAAVALDVEGSEDRMAEAVAASNGTLERIDGRLVLRKGSEDPAERMTLVLNLLEELA